MALGPLGGEGGGSRGAHLIVGCGRDGAKGSVSLTRGSTVQMGSTFFFEKMVGLH